MSLSLRLLLFGLAALLPAVAVVAWLELELRSARRTEVFTSAARQTDHAASELAHLVEGVRTGLAAIAASPAIRAADPAECNRYLTDLDERIHQIDALGVVTVDGALRCSSKPVSAAGRLLQEALASADLVVGTYADAQGNGGSRSLPFALAIRNGDGEVEAVAIALLEFGHLDALVRSFVMADDGSLTIADRDGIILARKPLPETFVGTRIPAPYLWWVTSPAPGTEEIVSQDGTRRVLAYKPVTLPPLDLYVSSGISSEVAFADVDRARGQSLAIIAGSLVATTLMATLVGRFFIREPVRHLVDLAEAWRRGDPPAEPPAFDDRELRDIADALDGMGRDLEERERQARADEERWRLTVRTLPFPVMLVDDTGEIIEASLTWFTLSGRYEDPPITAEDWFTIAFGPDDDPDDPVRHPFLDDRPVQGVERTVRWLDGREAVWEFAVVPLPALPDGTRLRLIAATDVTERKQAAEQQDLLLRELNHRVKNTLTLVQAIATQTFGSGLALEEAADAYSERLSALARTHELLTKEHWAGASIANIVAAELRHIPGENRIRIDGPPVQLRSETALALGLVIHELSTNAVKYGALSALSGRVDVTWTVFEDATGGHILQFRWTENGGPPVRPPARSGFGSRLISRTVRTLGVGGLEFTAQGVRFMLMLDPGIHMVPVRSDSAA